MKEGEQLGKYRIIRPLGKGGEGCVWLAQDESLSRRVAIKRLWDEDEERIRSEAAFLRDLRHAMLPVIYELFYEAGWYLVMEYVDGISLHKYIEAEGKLKEEQACIWAAALLDVLTYLHTRETPVIYRDLKPDNIMVCRDGSLKLVDFGAAVFRNFGGERDSRMAYTAGYAAPEQRGTGDMPAYADERSDIYAFGKIFYYMVTGANPGVPPYTALPPFLYNPLLSEGTEQVIARCVCEEPEARYQVAGEILADLQGRSRRRGRRRKGFLLHIEKQIYLTEKEGIALL